jgi:potassium-transporting ATPase potassium-binding subunit
MASDLLQILIYFAIILACTLLLGGYMARVFAGERTLLSPVLMPLERTIYRACGIAPRKNQHWTHYALAMLATNVVGWVILYAILRLQHLLPWNPQGMPPMAPDLAFNTAVSFVTNTNWQAYGGETTLS